MFSCGIGIVCAVLGNLSRRNDHASVKKKREKEKRKEREDLSQNFAEQGKGSRAESTTRAAASLAGGENGDDTSRAPRTRRSGSGVSGDRPPSRDPPADERRLHLLLRKQFHFVELCCATSKCIHQQIVFACRS